MSGKSNAQTVITVNAHQPGFVEVSPGIFIEPGKKKNEVRFSHWVKIEMLTFIFVLVLLINHCI